jgi:hypothetical protein
MLNSDVYWITCEMVVTCDLLCWITTILACMLIGLKSLVISLDYRSYMGSSARIWSFRWLFFYLCSYNLDGSITVTAWVWDMVTSEVILDTQGHSSPFSLERPTTRVSCEAFVFHWFSLVYSDEASFLVSKNLSCMPNLVYLRAGRWSHHWPQCHCSYQVWPRHAQRSSRRMLSCCQGKAQWAKMTWMGMANPFHGETAWCRIRVGARRLQLVFGHSIDH